MKLRFAPSPTGRLHVGNARLAVANYLFARQHKASLLLRIDDTDSGRGTREHAERIFRDLKWLGMEWDDQLYQSDRKARYGEVVERLKAEGHLYPCFESELELRYKREQRLRAGQPPVYDRGMLRMTVEQRERAEANGKRPYWRFRLSGRQIKWRDLVMGECRVSLPSLSDPVLVREDGSVLYSLASLIDDLDTGITHIIRGQDHVANTGIQLDIAKALGAGPERFVFAHLPLLLDEKGAKLSKRKGGDWALSSLRQDGIWPDALMSCLASLGSAADPVLRTREENIRHFDLGKMSRSSPRFDMNVLLGLNKKAWHELEFEAVKPLLPDPEDRSFWEAVRYNVEVSADIAQLYKIVRGEISPAFLPGEAAFLRGALELLPAAPWEAQDIWKEWTKRLQEKTGRKGKSLFHPLRLALTGEESGPELAKILPLMGREKAVRRLKETIALAEAAV